MRTVLYVDGFNLYYRLLRKRPELKWLNIRAMAEDILNDENIIEGVKYYTAHVSARVDADAPRRQQIYFDALSTIEGIEIVYGNFLVSKPYAGLVPQSGDGKPTFRPWPEVVRVYKTEEKGSDVNLGSHLVRDAFQDEFEVAAVVTNDTDLVEPIRIVREEVGKPVGILSPVSNAAHDLKRVASFLRIIRPGHLARAQFPNPLPRDGEADLVKPTEWVQR